MMQADAASASLAPLAKPDPRATARVGFGGAALVHLKHLQTKAPRAIGGQISGHAACFVVCTVGVVGHADDQRVGLPFR